MTVTTQAVTAAATSSDFTALATNIGVLIGFLTAAIVGIKAGLKKYAEAMKPSGPMEPSQAKLVAATLLENITLSKWSATNREVKGSLDKLVHALEEHTDEMRELRHTIQLDMATRR